MRVFEGWSGEVSLAVAEVLQRELPGVLRNCRFFVSSGISPGAEWQKSLLTEIDQADVAVICLTARRAYGQVLMWEAGALAAKSKPMIPLWINASPDPTVVPFNGVQAVKADQNGLLRLVQRLAVQSGSPSRDLVSRFEQAWPRIERGIAFALAVGERDSDNFAGAWSYLTRIVGGARSEWGGMIQIAEVPASKSGRMFHLRGERMWESGRIGSGQRQLASPMVWGTDEMIVVDGKLAFTYVIDLDRSRGIRFGHVNGEACRWDAFGRPCEARATMLHYPSNQRAVVSLTRVQAP